MQSTHATAYAFLEYATLLCQNPKRQALSVANGSGRKTLQDARRGRGFGRTDGKA
jgi:hypothetical protein